MVKAFNFFKRKPGLSVDDFRNYWLNEHAAIIRAIPELRKYVASITLPSAYRNREPLYDGISEAWFDDENVLRATANSAPRRAAHTDDAKFVDMSTTGSIITDEIVQKDGKPRRRRGEDVLSADAQARHRRTRLPGLLANKSRPARRKNPASPPLPAMPRAVSPHMLTAKRRATMASQSYGSTASTRCVIPATPTSIAQ